MIEATGSAKLPLGMTPARFLRHYWQKKPLLIRGFANSGFDSVTPDDLGGLACEEAALSRIVTRTLQSAKTLDSGVRRNDANWSVRNGPFRESDFRKLGKDNWTLLVQDVDKWDMDVAAELYRFAFIPAWRIDDVMISYATDGGGVGPHVDRYDVFLVQAAGARRWSISTDPQATMEFRADSELRLLKEFSPTHEWLLEPGDALYLPPGIPHDGVAVGECMTWSVGMRAPSQAELLLDFAEFIAEPLGDELRYADPDLAPVRAQGEIDAAALRRVRSALPHISTVDESILARWFGCFITRYRSAQIAAAPDRAPNSAALRNALPGAIVLRNPFSRFAWRRDGRAAQLFVAGEAWACSVAMAKLLASERSFPGSAVSAACRDPVSQQTLVALVAAGHLQLSRRGKRAR